jgi:CRP-like cAMP-binding protein
MVIKRYNAGLPEFDRVFSEEVQLGTGAYFGELALINNKPRAATIRCLSDCHFAVITKNVYEKALKKIEIKNQNQLVDFLKHLPFFAGWSRTALARLK